MQNVMDFPFLAKPKDSASQALTAMLDGGWFSNKKGQNWVAAGLTVIAFEMLTVSAVVVVEWGSGVKLGLFGIATAEMPRQLSTKFAVVQLGIVATIDVDAGIMKVDGQLTPASYVLDPSCHLTGGFALYSWFGSGGGSQQGDWVFTIGGYHAAYAKPLAYPSPPRLAISWSYNKCINITGKAYFAVTPKVCMGGGSLRVTLSLGPCTPISTPTQTSSSITALSCTRPVAVSLLAYASRSTCGWSPSPSRSASAPSSHSGVRPWPARCTSTLRVWI